MPLRSPLRGRRVVAGTEKTNSPVPSTSRWAMVVFPVPLGAASTTGRAFVGLLMLLDVLQLLAQALDLLLDGDRRARDSGVVRLGPDRVRLPVHLLHEEPEPLPHR